MTIRTRSTGIVFVLLAATALSLTSTRGIAQQPFRFDVRQQSIGASTANLTELRAWDAFVDGSVRDGRLVRRAGYPDSSRPGRRVESFVQQYGGLEVYGGDVSRILDNNVTIAMSGKVYEDIEVNVVPRIGAATAAAAIERAAGSSIYESDPPQLMILPYLSSRYVLVYRATARDQFTYFLDAHSGEVVHKEDLRIEQSAVGRGTGHLGDSKKVSASSRPGNFITLDVLRPAQISTFSVNTTTNAGRLSGGGPSNDSDFANSTNNVWTTGNVVDAHVHTGYTYDYFFKRHNYRGLDDQNGAIYSTVVPASLLLNNAFFTSPPSGPNGAGGMFYGARSSGAPMTTLDIVGHEMMHAVTFFNLRRRTGFGLGSNLVITVGPAGCALPFWCDGNNRFLLFSDQSGAINEGLSDIFGAAVEFMFHPPGDGPLRADYVAGEDTGSAIRTLSDPQSFSIGANRPYPDHTARRFQFPMIFVSNGPLICSGTNLPPTRCDLHPTFYAGDQVVAQLTYAPGQGLAQTDGGAVHWNLTILGHAYYLAIEGGQNRTSGITVQGVGQANRDQIERVFFTAVRDFLPRFATFTQVANALRQAAVAVHGAGSNPARAVDQALLAVGL